jgi:membrane protease subunit HflK
MSNDQPHSGHDHEHDEKSPGSAPSPDVEDAGAQALADALRSSFGVVKFLMALLVLAFVVSCIFTVRPNEVAVVLRLGKPRGIGAERILRPGLHWALPYPIDEIVRIPVGQSHTATSTAGWYYTTPEEEASGAKPAPLPYLRPGVDGYTLTGDGNIIHVRVTVSYRITDPLSYQFNFASATNLLQHALDNALFYASARFTADDALYLNKLRFQEAVLARVNETLAKLKLGVTIETSEVRVTPPLDVDEAFANVIKAQQQGDIKIRDAQAYARGATNKAVGEASVIVRDGVTASNYLVQTVAAEAQRFNDLLPRYRSDPDLFKQRLLAETVQRVLTNAQYKLFLPERADGERRELRLQLSKPTEVPVKEKPNP